MCKIGALHALVSIQILTVVLVIYTVYTVYFFQNDQSALHIAARNNRIQIMELLIKEDWNVNNNDKVHVRQIMLQTFTCFIVLMYH